MDVAWDILNKIAVIGTIIGIPVTIVGIYHLINGSIIVYDSYREENTAGGQTIVIGNFSKRDCRKGKKENPNRKYHKKGYDFDNENSWV